MLQYVTELDFAPLRHTRGRSRPGYQEYGTISITLYFKNKKPSEEFMPIRKQLQNQIKMGGSSSR